MIYKNIIMILCLLLLLLLVVHYINSKKNIYKPKSKQHNLGEINESDSLEQLVSKSIYSSSCSGEEDCYI